MLEPSKLVAIVPFFSSKNLSDAQAYTIWKKGEEVRRIGQEDRSEYQFVHRNSSSSTCALDTLSF